MTRPLPEHLAGTSPRGLVPGEPVAQFELGPMKNFVYLLIDWDARRAALVDPQEDIETPLEALARHGVELEKVLITHTHFDHVAGLPALVKEKRDLEVLLHRADLHRVERTLKDAGEGRTHLVADGEAFTIGELQARALHTPGHSAGHACWHLPALDPPLLVTGDTIFIRDCGRTDLDTGSDAAMFASIQRVKALPPDTVILPGHHYRTEVASTVEREVASSPPFRVKTVEELAALP
jgi:glyoxylase-like metal-dependent hydrolase (beta-lactamase superfamily II)